MNTLNTAEIAPPPVNRDMRELDRSFFNVKLQVSGLTVLNPRDIQKVKNKLAAAHDLLVTPTIKPVVDDEVHPGKKRVLLRPHVSATDPSTWNQKWKDIIDDGSTEIHPHELTITYDNWSMSEILNAVLPEEPLSAQEDTPSGFAQVGHVAHLNLKEFFNEYKHLIGQVLLDKNPNIKTVINKLHDVGSESVFRTFPYEVLAGPDDLEVTISHLSCQFRFNYAEVYWNIRNSHEHERLIAQFQKNEVVCDVMAGVGPFALPAAKKGAWVWANDLNPASYKAMCNAIHVNKLSHHVYAFNMDGAQFIRSAAQTLLRTQRRYEQVPATSIPRNATEKQRQKLAAEMKAATVTRVEPPTFDHFVMNLPAIAVEFLHAFRGLYHGHERLFGGSEGRRLPMIHVYCFQARKDDESEEREELLQRICGHLGHQLSPDEVVLERLRLVAPKKLYYCASFRLPGAVAFAAPRDTGEVPLLELFETVGPTKAR
ncbi:tRNA(m(1)G37)methyltransferase [Lithohypha guttulata]|uniref:tRNA (guanine(37)-N1)-methyltransferase n=1 Tax=Lithohypha guttulata TaxID=1690604 RepID=A0AAN7T4F2_9EURO|nr:tRNA(m(1)G37)methyltransferase [Lithohypha guttulata]